ncbi:hypothetical protein HYW32_02950 [Candidatus Berkelbacteria bacterium]|nr:hypothetical protein [Candidatus Berkelbacteria bacterium]
MESQCNPDNQPRFEVIASVGEVEDLSKAIEVFLGANPEDHYFTIQYNQRVDGVVFVLARVAWDKVTPPTLLLEDSTLPGYPDTCRRNMIRVLQDGGIYTIQQLLETSATDLLRIKGMSVSRLRRIKRLVFNGIKLKHAGISRYLRDRAKDKVEIGRIPSASNFYSAEADIQMLDESILDVVKKLKIFGPLAFALQIPRQCETSIDWERNRPPLWNNAPDATLRVLADTYTPKALREVFGVGESSARLIEEFLSDLGLELQKDDE